MARKEVTKPQEIIPLEEARKTLYLAYSIALLAGFAFPIAGIVSPQIALHFHVLTEHIVVLDALGLIGLIIGNATSGKMMRLVGGKGTLSTAVCLLFLVHLGIALQNSLYIYAILILLSGFSMGLLIPSVSFIVVAACNRNGLGESKLNIMNFYVGIGCFLGTTCSGIIVHNLSWRAIFFITSTIFLLSFIISKCTRIREYREVDLIDKNDKTQKEKKTTKPINVNIVLIGLALISYVYVEYVITYWFSPYLQESLKYGVETVGFMLGAFWLALAVGRLIFGKFVIPRISGIIFIFLASICTIISFFLFILTANIIMIFISVILLGLSCAGLFPTLLGYGMKQSGILSPLTMAFLITSSSLGGAISLLSSASIGLHFNKIAAIYMGPVGAILIIIFTFASVLLYRKKRT